MKEKTGNIVFELNEIESERARVFIKEHTACPSRSMGEKFIISFMPSTLGDLVRICCLSCGAEKEITDTDKL